MEGTPLDYSKGLKTQSEMLLAASQFTAKSSDQPRRDRYCRLIILRTSDLLGSASYFMRGADIVAGHIIMRSMLEDLIRILWATLSEENADHLVSYGLDEFKTAFRVNLETGTARVTDADGRDHSQRFLKGGKLGRVVKKKSVETMASEAGALGLYNMFYRFASLHTHGNLLDEPRTDDPADICAMLSALGAISKAAGHVGIRWLLGRERPSNTELLELLGVS